jgi:epoxyqueuosine reductase
VALRFRVPWQRDSHNQDPYWQFFLHRAPADLANTVTDLIRNAPEGNVFPTRADMHTPAITSNHVKEMARYFGADLVGIAQLECDDLSPAEAKTAGASESYPYAVICVVRADQDPRTAPGIGGQVPVQNGLFITFVLSAWIRELGFRATAKQEGNRELLAARAGLGKLNADGKLLTAQYGARVHVAEIIATDLPLAPDGGAT